MDPPAPRGVGRRTGVPRAGREPRGLLRLGEASDLRARVAPAGPDRADPRRARLVAQHLRQPARDGGAEGRRRGALLHHSDRGVQYACGWYRSLLDARGIACSMSRRGNCYDNACVESFFGTFKTELVHREHYRTRAEARSSVFEWIECWYNRRRRHSSLGYVSPEAFEAQTN